MPEGLHGQLRAQALLAHHLQEVVDDGHGQGLTPR
jgi:hypothetical protein